jgi:hypothetical protein
MIFTFGFAPKKFIIYILSLSHRVYFRELIVTSNNGRLKSISEARLSCCHGLALLSKFKALTKKATTRNENQFCVSFCVIKQL